MGNSEIKSAINGLFDSVKENAVREYRIKLYKDITAHIERAEKKTYATQAEKDIYISALKEMRNAIQP